MASIGRITPLQVRDKLAAGEKLRLVDCREPEEHAFCRIGDSTLIPLGDLHRRAGEIELAEDELLVVYCHHGVRSLKACAVLQMHEIPALSMDGGIDQWSVQVDPGVPRY